MAETATHACHWGTTGSAALTQGAGPNVAIHHALQHAYRWHIAWTPSCGTFRWCKHYVWRWHDVSAQAYQRLKGHEPDSPPRALHADSRL